MKTAVMHTCQMQPYLLTIAIFLFLLFLGLNISTLDLVPASKVEGPQYHIKIWTTYKSFLISITFYLNILCYEYKHYLPESPFSPFISSPIAGTVWISVFGE